MFIGIFTGCLLIALGATLWSVTAAAASGRLPRNGWAGIRVGTTLASDEAWLAGHRAALPLSRALGIGIGAIGVVMTIDGVVTREEEGSILYWLLFVLGVGGVLIGCVIAGIQASRAARRAESADGGG